MGKDVDNAGAWKIWEPSGGGGLPYLPHPLDNLLLRGSRFPTLTTSLPLGFFPDGTGKKDGATICIEKNNFKVNGVALRHVGIPLSLWGLLPTIIIL